MLRKTNYTVPNDILQQAIAQPETGEFKFVLNQPTGDFFYDPWEIKPELKNTVWEELLNTLPETKGEARIITLAPGTNYYSHADADDRWHLTLKAENAFICDIDDSKMYELKADGIWYSMNAGPRHSAANFGNFNRVQLVVRQLFNRVDLVHPVKIKIILKTPVPDFRYQFDNTVSTWLNAARKSNLISEFIFADNVIEFQVERLALQDLKKVLPDIFEVVEL